MLVARAIRNMPATLTVTFYNDETPVDADAAVTVTITKADGTAIATAAATVHGATGVYTYTLAAQTALNYLTVVWTGLFGGLSRSTTTYCEIRGGEIFTLAEARASDKVLLDTIRFPTQLIKDTRCEIEDEFESITYVSFVPRYRMRTLDGSGTYSQVMLDRNIRSISAASIFNVALTTTELASVKGTRYGELQRTDAGFWNLGYLNVTVEYEYGYDAPPADIRRAALTRLRTRLTATISGIPDRATSFTAIEGGTYSLSTAGRAGYTTGIPDVDAVLARYTEQIPGIA